MCQIIMKTNQLDMDDVRDFIIYNVIFTSCNDSFTVKGLKNQLDEFKCSIDIEYLKRKLISFAEKGLIVQTCKGYAVNN